MSTEPNQSADLRLEPDSPVTALWKRLAHAVANGGLGAIQIVAELFAIDEDLKTAVSGTSPVTMTATLQQWYLFIRGAIALQYLDFGFATVLFQKATELDAASEVYVAASRQLHYLSTFQVDLYQMRTQIADSLRRADLESALSRDLQGGLLSRLPAEREKEIERAIEIERAKEFESAREFERAREDVRFRRDQDQHYDMDQVRWADQSERIRRQTEEDERIRRQMDEHWDSFALPPVGWGHVEKEPAVSVVERTPHMDLSIGEPITPGTRFQVRIYADTSAARESEVSENIAVALPLSIARVDVEVWLAGTAHFEIQSRTAQIISIDRNSTRTADVSFDVLAKEENAVEGRAALHAYFFYNGRPCGLVWRVVDLLSQAVRKDSIALSDTSDPISSIAPEILARSPDLTVEVTNPSKDGETFRVRVTTRLLSPAEQPEPEEWKPGNTANLVDAVMEEFVDEHATPYARTLSLKGAGEDFFSIAPECFKRLLWQLIDRGTPPKSIYVVTQEAYIPWELMIPNRESDGHRPREPLGVEFAVGRWITQNHRSPRQSLPLTSSWVIAPRYEGSPASLPHAEAEAEYVCQTLAGNKVDPADVEGIDKMLHDEPRSLVHFVCHGAKGRPGIQVIYVQGNEQRLTSKMARAMEGVKAQCAAGAVIFLNSCEVGQPVPALAGGGGFARVFTEFGAGAVIAPLWSVDDTLAHDVATRFYAEVVSGSRRPYAEILRDIRRRAYNPQTGLDTYAAYCFYGDPCARAAE